MAGDAFETHGADELGRDLLALAEDLINQKSLGRLGEGAKRIIKDLTRRGLDYEENAFESYSEGHAEKRRKEGLPTSRVDLKFSQYGSSMDKLDHEVSGSLDEVIILFDDARAEEIMTYHNALGAGRSKVIRQNMAFSEKSIDKLQQLLEEDITQLMKLHELG